MAEKKFDTRILLKYDSLSNWNSSTLVLKAGEVAIATVPTSESVSVQSGVITPPAAVIFKVGDGSSTFSQLPIVSALAADVYGWAKKSEDEFKTWLDSDAGFATDAELTAVKSALEAKDKTLEELIAAIEGGEGGSEGGLTGVYTRLTDLETILSSFLPEEGESAVSDAVRAAIDAVASSVTSLTSRVESVEAAVSSLQAADAAMQSDIANLKKEVTGEGLEEGELSLSDKVAQVETDIESIESSIGEVAEGETLVGMIEAAEEAANSYTNQQITLVNANVSALEPRIVANEAAIAVLNGSGEGSVDYKVATAIAGVVADAPEDFDTLVEIANYIASDKTNAAEINNKLADHDSSIAALLAQDVTLQTNIDNLEADLIARIEEITGGEGTDGTLADLEKRVAANEEAIESIESKIGTVAEGQNLANLIALNTAKISGVETTVGNHTTLIEGLRTDLNVEAERAAAAEETLTNSLNAEIERATAAEEANTNLITTLNVKVDGLHEVARTGLINDLSQSGDEELVFDCGNATGYNTEA